MLAMINKCVIKITTCYCITTKISKLLWDKAEKVRDKWLGGGGEVNVRHAAIIHALR